MYRVPRRLMLALLVLPFALRLLTGQTARAEESEETPEQRYVLGIERIWDRPGHAAFTDILLHEGALYCTFREGTGHIPGLNGMIRVLRSRDRTHWESIALLSEEHVDLRDPKLSVTPQGRLMVNMGASYYRGTKRLRIESRVSFAGSDGTSFGSPQRVVVPKEILTGSDWLWRVTWHKETAWGCLQQSPPGGNEKRALWLVKSRDGIHFEPVTKLEVPFPTETTLRFRADDTLIAMARCEGKPAIGRIGIASPPYKDWKFTESNKRFGGPNLVELPGGRWLAGSRQYDPPPSRTALWWFDPDKAEFSDLLLLPSDGDNSYPGFAIDAERGVVYTSYYSSHEGKAAIYVATLRLDALREKSE